MLYLLDVLAGIERLSEKQEARVVFLLNTALNLVCIIAACFGGIWLMDAFISSLEVWGR